MRHTSLDEKKAVATAWFRTLRDQICAEFEKIETEYTNTNPLHNAVPGADGPGPSGKTATQKFTRTAWSRDDGGTGEISIMKGRVFEKVGVNISTVHGEFSEQFRKEIPGASENPKFWASGISLVAHMQSPLVPAAHFNTRMICIGDQPARLWFGGGGDLNPMFEDHADTADFHAAFKTVCDQLDMASRASEPSASGAARSIGQQTNAEQSNKGVYEAFKNWCDEYFFIPHRNVARGVGGIFYDYLGLNKLGTDTSIATSGQFGKGGLGKEATAAGFELAANANLDWQQGFDFTRQVGEAFASIYPVIIRRHMFEKWTDEQRHHQLVKRGRYAEYNLLYDRGTRFGLMTGGNPEAILMSLPPVAIWE
ncbi:MAG: coproporphyrinogen III oxidase [Rickettsiales bacterium]